MAGKKPEPALTFAHKPLWKTQDAPVQGLQKATVVNEQFFMSDISVPS